MNTAVPTTATYSPQRFISHRPTASSHQQFGSADQGIVSLRPKTLESVKDI